MATRMYFPETEEAPITTISPASGWVSTGQMLRRKLADVKGSSAITIGTRITITSGATNFALDRQYVSTRMAAGINLGNMVTSGQLMCREYANTDDSDRVVLGVRIVSEDGTTVRKTLYAVASTYGISAEFINNATHRNKTFIDGDTSDLTAYTSVLGDRIVVEIGFRGVGTTPEASAKWGENATDLPVNETQTTDGAGWIEFSTDITFAGEVSGPVGKLYQAKQAVKRASYY